MRGPLLVARAAPGRGDEGGGAAKVVRGVTGVL